MESTSNYNNELRVLESKGEISGDSFEELLPIALKNPSCGEGTRALVGSLDNDHMIFPL